MARYERGPQASEFLGDRGSLRAGSPSDGQRAGRIQAACASGSHRTPRWRKGDSNSQSRPGSQGGSNSLSAAGSYFRAAFSASRSTRKRSRRASNSAMSRPAATSAMPWASRCRNSGVNPDCPSSPTNSPSVLRIGQGNDRYGDQRRSGLRWALMGPHLTFHLAGGSAASIIFSTNSRRRWRTGGRPWAIRR